MRAHSLAVVGTALLTLAKPIGPARAEPPAPAPLSTCAAELARRGVAFTPMTTLAGVADPIQLHFPLGEVRFRYRDESSPWATVHMDCRLALSLVDTAAVLAKLGVVEVIDLGVYKYRCKDRRGEPPRCEGGSLSRHAHGLAIDIAGLVTADGTVYSIERDWLIDLGTHGPACDRNRLARARRRSPRSAFLHQAVCALFARRLFSAYVTPNYNVAHRNHLHLQILPAASRGGKDPRQPAPPRAATRRSSPSR